MTIGQMISKQKDGFDFVNINYTGENGILWHIQLPFEKAKSCDAIMQCGYQTFEESHCRGKNTGIFDIVSSDLPENITQKSDSVFPNASQPAKRSDFESNEMTARDYIDARNDVESIVFSLNTPVGYWETDAVDIQKLPEPMSSLMHLFVDNAGLSAIDNTILNIYLLTKESEHKKKEQKQEKEKKQEDVKKQKEVEKIFAIVFCAISCSVFITFAIGAIVGALSGWHGVSLFNISGVDSIKKVIANIFIGSVGFSSLSVLFWVIITYFVRRHFSSTSQSKDLFDQVFKK